jgi:hypothetical protein
MDRKKLRTVQPVVKGNDVLPTELKIISACGAHS